MRHSQGICSGQQKEKSVHPLPIGSCGLSCTFVAVPDLNIGAGNHRIGLIGDDARERPRRRGLGGQFTWRTDRQNSQE